MSDPKNIKSYSAADIQNYLEGKLSEEEMHAIEKAALDDPFVADAIEGMEKSISQRGSSSLHVDINDLEKRLSERINETRKAKLIAINRIRWQVAVSLLILTTAGILTYNYFSKNNVVNKNIAQAKEKTSVTDSATFKKDSTTISTKPQTASNTNLGFTLNEKKEKQKTRRISIKSNIAPKEKLVDTLNDDKNTVASANLPTIQNKSFKKDTSAVFEETRKRTVVKDIAFYNSNEFIGKVVDVNSQPISGAYVNIANQKNATVTDNRGMFKLFAPKQDSIVKINVTSVGFESAKAILVNDKDIADNTINLRSNTSPLNEVVVTRLGNKKKNDTKNLASVETLKSTEPVTGWKKYKEYLDKNKRLSGDSIGLRIIEVVSFSVKKNGKLSNFNIEQSYNDDFDDEAIRLIKTGPAWKLLKNKKARATLTIEF